jgi:SagB-type dehydrogenase family enzyme
MPESGGHAYRLRDDIAISLSPTSQTLEIRFGSGSSRECLCVDRPEVLPWLLRQRQARSADALLHDACTEFDGSADDVRPLVRAFIESGLFVADATRKDRRTPEEIAWHSRGWADAASFHRAVRDLEFLAGDDEGWTEQIEIVASWVDAVDAGSEIPSPGPYRPVADPAAKLLPLARFIGDEARTPVQDALLRRRTCRDFNNRELPFADFSKLMGYACGKTGELDFGRLGTHLLKTSPSGGARHPIEAYVAVFSVQSMTPGLYHYDVEHHGMRLLREGRFGDEVYHLCHRQKGMRGVSAVVFFTARWMRHIWKYRYARSYRMVHFDCAHMVQSFLIAATDLGFDSFLTPALRDSEAEEFLGIDDPFAESVLYAVSVG